MKSSQYVNNIYHLVEFLHMCLKEVFGRSVEFVGHWFWVRDADCIDVGETIVPDGTCDAAATYHNADSVTQLLPDYFKVNTSWLQ